MRISDNYNARIYKQHDLVQQNPATNQLIFTPKANAKSSENNIIDNKNLNSLLNGDYSILSTIDYTTIEGVQESIELLKDFKKAKGISIYQDVLNNYKNGTLAENNFIEYMNEIYDMTNFSNKEDGFTDEIRQLSEDYMNMLYLANKGFISIEDFENFNFDKYFEELTIPQATTLIKNYKEIKKRENYDPTVSQIAPMLPKISTNRIDGNTVIQNFNDKNYTIIYSNSGITINDDNGQEYTLDYNKLLSNIENENDKQNVISRIKGLTAPILIDLSIEIDYIKVHHDDNPNSSCAFYDDINNIISINLSKEFNKNSVYELAHEIGHALDYVNVNKKNETISGYDEEFIRIAESELEKLKDKPVYERGYATTNPVEMFAECYALLQTGSSASSNYVIATYFPKTLAYVANKIEELRQKTNEDRHYISEKEIDIRDLIYGKRVPNWLD